MVQQHTTTNHIQVGIPSPNPSYPQDIEVVRGKNLLKLANGTYTSGNVSAVVNNGIITLNGTSGSSVSTIAIPFTTTLNGEYTLSANNEVIGTSSNWTGMRLKENSSTTISSTQIYFITANASATFTLENKAVQVFELRLGTSVTYTNYVIKPQLEKGSSATSYLPYNTQEVVVREKNLFDNTVLPKVSNYCNVETINTGKRIVNTGGTITGPRLCVFAIKDLTNFVGKTIRFKADFLPSASNDGRFYIGLCDSNGGNRTVISTKDTSGETASFVVPTLSSTVTFLCLGIYANVSGTCNQNDYVDYTNMTLTIDNEDMTYEPYITPITKQLSLGDIELAKIGNYRDYIYKNEGKWYKHSEIGVLTANGIEDWQDRPNYNLADRFVCSGLVNSLQNYHQGYANYFKVKWNDATDYPYLDYNGTQLLINFSAKGTTSLEQFKTWLSTHNLLGYYKLKTSTDTEITDTTLINQLEDIYNMQSVNGTTIVEINGNLPMIIKCRALKGE